MAESRQELQAQEAESRIFAFIRRELLSPGATVDRHDDLLSDDVLDSVGVLRLAVFVEEEFRINMQPTDFVIENFQTIAVLAEYVCRAAGRAGRR